MCRRILMTGNDAIGAAAIQVGCDAYFGYPITPQNELTAYMARHMPDHGHVFIQAESELAAINMVYGASAAGKRAMTSSSSPGISLKQEGISFLAGAELPAVIVNVQRGGPGLGNIAPSQADYFQAVKGGGHGDYRQIVLAPYNVQEMYDLTCLAFDLADRYRTPAMVLTDGRLGQMMEPMVCHDHQPACIDKPWALTGAVGRDPNIIRSLYLDAEMLEEVNLRLKSRYDRIASDETRFDTLHADDCDVLLVAYGTSARVAEGCVVEARRQGIKAGLLRPITLWPFPGEAIHTYAAQVEKLLVVEMSMGQLVEDVERVVRGRRPVHFKGRTGGVVPTQGEVMEAIGSIA